MLMQCPRLLHDDLIVIVLNPTQGTHWVCIVIDMRMGQRCLTYYDSLVCVSHLVGTLVTAPYTRDCRPATDESSCSWSRHHAQLRAVAPDLLVRG